MAKITELLPTNIFDHIEIGAGIILNNFDTESWTPSASAIIGATSGGINFTDTPTYTDFGEDIDNCPKNTKELKMLDSREIKLSGTYVSLNPNEIKSLIASADIDEGSKVITPRSTISEEDFSDIWFVGDYGVDNCVAIHLENALSTGGFSLQTADKSKGQFAFEYTAHYSSNDSTKVPYTVYFKK